MTRMPPRSPHALLAIARCKLQLLDDHDPDAVRRRSELEERIAALEAEISEQLRLPEDSDFE